MEPKCLTADRFVDKNTNISYRYVFSQTEYFRPHYHDYFEMFLVLDGQVIHSANGEERRLSGGDLVFIRDRDVHDHRMEEGQTVSMLPTFLLFSISAVKRKHALCSMIFTIIYTAKADTATSGLCGMISPCLWRMLLRLTLR